jgi:hypothetical protein
MMDEKLCNRFFTYNSSVDSKKLPNREDSFLVPKTLPNSEDSFFAPKKLPNREYSFLVPLDNLSTVQCGNYLKCPCQSAQYSAYDNQHNLVFFKCWVSVKTM